MALEADFAIPVSAGLGELGVLTEPASVLAKAWEQIERIRSARLRRARTGTDHRRGADRPAGGADGQCSAASTLMCSTAPSPASSPSSCARSGAGYHTGSIAEVCEDAEPDVIVECTGVAQLVVDAMRYTAPGAIVCLTGVAPSRSLSVDVGEINNEIVLENDVVFGSVNANRRHFEQAAAALSAADRDWLGRLITRSVPLERWQEALDKGDEDIKVVVELAR